MQMVIKEGILLGAFLLLLEILRFRAAALNGDRVVVVMIVILPPRKFSKLWGIFFFYCYSWGLGGCCWSLEARDASKYPIIHTHKKLPRERMI